MLASSNNEYIVGWAVFIYFNIISDQVSKSFLPPLLIHNQQWGEPIFNFCLLTFTFAFFFVLTLFWFQIYTSLIKSKKEFYN